MHKGPIELALMCLRESACTETVSQGAGHKGPGHHFQGVCTQIFGGDYCVRWSISNM